VAIGTDKEILGKEISIREETGGRPRVNRELGYQLIKAGYSTQYITRVLGWKSRTVRLMRQELKSRGELEEIEKTEELDKISEQFDEECKRAMKISFYEWLKNKTKGYRGHFGFCKAVWERVWGKPSLVLVRDRDNPLGDQLAQKWLTVFGEDTKRLRRRKKHIRQLFTFLGREDINNRFLKISRSREPEEVREIPQLTMMDFPEKLSRAFVILRDRLGEEYELALKFKLVTQMRTGESLRELLGIRVQETNHSYIIMNSVDDWKGEVTAKGMEKWIIEWIPFEIRERLYNLIQLRTVGEPLFKINIRLLRKAWREITEEVGLPPLRLHDLRKVSITWFWVMGIELLTAVELNVGWKDLNTAKKFYLRCSELLKKSDRLKYRELIPSWFKEGLSEYLPY